MVTPKNAHKKIFCSKGKEIKDLIAENIVLKDLMELIAKNITAENIVLKNRIAKSAVVLLFGVLLITMGLADTKALKAKSTTQATTYSKESNQNIKSQTSKLTATCVDDTKSGLKLATSDDKEIIIDNPEDRFEADPEANKNTVEYNYEFENNGVYATPSTTMPKVRSIFTTSTYRHASRFKGYTIENGIDVSEHQGVINWEKAKRDGVKFAIIRVGYRGVGSGSLNPDKYYVQNIRNAVRAGVKVGVYIYSQAITPAEARAEANYVIKRVKNYKISLPIVLDYEFYTATSGRLAKAKLSKRAGTDVCTAFCKTVENAGYTPMVYGNPDMFYNHLYGEEIAKHYQIWLANFGKNNGHDKGFATIYDGTYQYWQYTSVGRVAGIRGNVDCNFWYKTSETVKESKAVRKINITDSNIPATVKTGNSIYLYYSLEPAGVVDEIKWTSSRPNVAYVKDGTVYGVSGGETIITATTKSGASASRKVIVSENMNEYAIQYVNNDKAEIVYNGRKQQPAIEVVSKKKVATTGTIKSKTSPMFAGPKITYTIEKTLTKGNEIIIYATEKEYYAVSFKNKNTTFYGYVNKSDVTASSNYKTLVQDEDYTVEYNDTDKVGFHTIEAVASSSGIYSGRISAPITVKEESITEARVDYISDQIANEGLVEPKVNLRYKGVELINGVDYEVRYSDHAASAEAVLGSNSHKAVVTIIGKGNFTGSTTTTFDIGTSTVTSIDAIPAQNYTGKAITPELVVKAGEKKLEKEKDYSVTYENNIEIGSGVARVTLLGEYATEGTITQCFPIVEKDIATAQVTVEQQALTFDKTEKVPTLNVTCDGVTLTKDVDYTLECSNNYCAGTANYIIVGKGSYRGEKTGTFTISPADISIATIDEIGTKSYTAREQIPDLQVYNGNTKLFLGTDYTVACENNKEIGSATIVVTGIGNYSGSVARTFTITKRKMNTLSFSKIATQKYKRKAIKPAISIRNNGVKLKKGKDYKLSYKKNKSRGKATIIMRGTGKYTGTKKIYFRIY